MRACGHGHIGSQTQGCAPCQVAPGKGVIKSTRNRTRNCMISVSFRRWLQPFCEAPWAFNLMAPSVQETPGGQNSAKETPFGPKSKAGGVSRRLGCSRHAVSQPPRTASLLRRVPGGRTLRRRAAASFAEAVTPGGDPGPLLRSSRAQARRKAENLARTIRLLFNFPRNK